MSTLAGLGNEVRLANFANFSLRVKHMQLICRTKLQGTDQPELREGRENQRFKFLRIGVHSFQCN